MKITIRILNIFFKTNICYIICLFLFTTCLVSNKNENTNLIANWYYLGIDSAYSEVYITDSSMLFYSDEVGISGPYSYKLDSTRILFLNEKSKELEYFSTIIFNSKKRIILNFKNKNLNLYRIENINLVPNDCKNEEDFNRFLDSFYMRSCIFFFGKNRCKNYEYQIIDSLEEFTP